jgi:titin
VTATSGIQTTTATLTVTPAVAPDTASALVATGGNSQVALSWTAPVSNGGTPVTDYIVQYSTDAVTWVTFADGTSTTTSATVTGLTNGTAYFFQVSAVNAAGVSAPDASTAIAVTPSAA